MLQQATRTCFLNLYLRITGIPPFLKVHVILLHFYETHTLVPIFTNQKKSKEDFHLVIASFTLSLSVYERFYRNALHSVSGGNVFIL